MRASGSIWRPSTWRWLSSFAVLFAIAPAVADASFWPAAGGSSARAGAQETEPGVLPASVAWAYGGEDVRTPPVITGGDGPSAQRVAYGTADGRVRLRTLDTGVEVGPAGGTDVVDAAVTDPQDAFASGFISSSTNASAGILYVVHDDGGGVEIARFDERTGTRMGEDVSVPGSLGCAEAGAPLLTAKAGDNTQLLFFTIRGTCAAGSGLVRFGVSASGELMRADAAPVSGLAVAPPALVVVGGAFYVAVAHTGGVDFRRADARFDGPAELSVDFDAAEEPMALAWTGPELLALTAAGQGSRVRRVALEPQPRNAGTVAVAGAPAGLAVSSSGRIAAATSAGLSILGPELTVIGTSPGAASAPSVSGAYAYVAGRAVRLADAGTQTLPGAVQVAPAIARGYVVFGSGALMTSDPSPPALTFAADRLSVTAADDQGVADVTFRLDDREIPAATTGSPWGPAAYAPATATIAPGRYLFFVLARDRAGNVARGRATAVVDCGHSVRGGPARDVLRGTSSPDCVDGRSGDDKLLVAGGGADRVTCGRGRDRVRADATDRVADDCERVRRARQ